jgi:uncharacterized protein
MRISDCGFKEAMILTVQSAFRIHFMSRPVVIVMVKAPTPGSVKTRLVPPLTAEEASAAALCFAQDTVVNARRVAADVLIAYMPSGGRAVLEPLLPGGLHWAEQRGRDLGERLEAIVGHADAVGFKPLIITGTDSPTLPVSFVETARDALDKGDADVALGPTADGGYYLVGLRAPAPGLFRGVAWSTPLAYRQTADNAARLGLRLLELPQWYDVDEHSDLTRLREEMLTDEEARARAPHTYRWILKHHPPPPS